MPRKPTSIERFNRLSATEKAAELAALEEFDRRHPGPTRGVRPPGRALTAVERRLWAKAKKKLPRGRPAVGLGAKIVPVSIERGLLQQADRFARQHKLKRSQMVAEGLRMVMERKAS